MTTVALGQQLIFPVLAVGIVALVVSAIGHGYLPGFFRFLLWLWFIGMLAVLFGMTFGRLAPAEARRPGALPRHGRQRAGADRLSCRRQRRPDRRRRARAQDRVQPHAQGGRRDGHRRHPGTAAGRDLRGVLRPAGRLRRQPALHGDPASSAEGAGPAAARRRCWPRRCRTTPSCRMSWCRSRPSTRAACCGVASRRRQRSTGRATSCTSRCSTTAPTRPPSSPAPWWRSSRRKGFDIVALQRTDRSGFKGGALHEAMQQTPHDYFAIFDVDYVPAPDFLRICMRPFFAESEEGGQLGVRAGALRLPQSARERADRDADGDPRRPSRHRAGDPLLGRPSAALQRHLRHLAARGHRGRRRLEGRYRHRGSRPHLSRLGQGLAGAVPDERAGAGRAAGRHQDLAAPAAALAGRLPSCRAAHVPGRS